VNTSQPNSTTADRPIGWELEVAGWQVHITLLRLMRGEQVKKLEPKVMQVLTLLASRPGESFTRQELAAEVWPGVIVGDDAITNAINKLRKAFEDDPRDPQIIETIPRVGYRLIAAVSRRQQGEEPKAAHLDRKLAAIFYADISGYSRLMGEDEEGTHRVVSEYMDYMTDSIVRNGGTVMHLAGDAVLADFPTALRAMECALQVQRALLSRNTLRPKTAKVLFRVGINLGDVLIDRGEIYGDGVNVAARLESLAEPGGICISRAVFDALGSKLPIDYRYLGEQQVKNIATPVHAYQVLLTPQLDGPRKVEKPGFWAYGIGASALVLLSLGAYLYFESRKDAESIDQGQVQLPREVKPSIAVLPLENISGDPSQDYFSDGLTDDLITDLSKVSEMLVISRNSSFHYRKTDLSPYEISDKLGVRYLLSGSVRRLGDQVRVNIGLTDSRSGQQIWSERYDGRMKDVFALQDNITRRVSATLAVQLQDAGADAAIGAGSLDPKAYDEFLRGMEYFRRLTREDFEFAVTHFEKALEIDSEYANAHAALAATYWEGWKADLHAGTGWPMAFWQKADEHLSHARTNPSSLMYRVSAEMLLYSRRFDEAIGEAREAIALDSNDPLGYIVLADVLVFSDRPRDALPYVETAMRFDPHYPGYYLTVRGRAFFSLGRYPEAADAFQRAIELDPQDPAPLIMQTAVHGQGYEAEQAETRLRQLETLYENSGLGRFSLDRLRNHWQFKNLSVREAIFEGLGKAGARGW
jgi:TolB-like protein/class 3 adenylate cyclase/Tfp pilus assembly protein PilF